METCFAGIMMAHVAKKELARRLDHAIGEKVGIEGLNTLLYGWKKFRKYGAKYLDALKHREWMYSVEVADFSEYAGYDLTESERNHFCESE